MPGVLGLSLLVIVSGLGLLQLAVRGHRAEHRLAVAVVAGIAFALFFVAPMAAALLVAACLGTRRLAASRVVVPDRLPPSWA
jgi:hypothetical protein